MGNILIGILLAAAAIPAGRQAENTVDIVAKVKTDIGAAIADSLSVWEFRDDEKPECAWKTVRLGHSSKDKKVRYRAEVVIPEVFAGKRLGGGEARLNLNFSGPADHKIEVFIDGKLAATMPEVDPSTRIMSYRPVTLTADAQPGATFEVEIVVTNPGIYPPHEFLDTTKNVGFRGASLELAAAAEMRQKLYELLINIEAGDTMLRPWEPRGYLAEKVWIERLDRSKIDPDERAKLRAALEEACGCFDLEALKAGDSAALLESMGSVYQALEPVGEFSKRFTVYAVGNAHIDLAWLWRVSETVRISANTFRSVLNNIAEFPDMVYAQSQAQAYEWVERAEPDLFAGIQAAVAAGNWDVVGGMWAEPDCNMPGGESWVRQFLYAQSYFKEKFGRAAWLGWNPDSFGYNWNMPQLYTKGGIRAFLTQKISWNDTTVFPYHLFWWESPDGTRILTYFPTGSYVERFDPRGMVDQMMRFEQNTGLKEMLVLFGFGNHGGGPNREMLLRAEMLRRQPVFPKIVFSSAHGFFERLRELDLGDIPVWRDELYLEGHRGTLTTQGATKKGNRECEALLEATEKAASVASLLGRPYPKERFLGAWKTVLLDQFHDILPGSSITPVYRDTAEDYARLRKLLGRTIEESLETVGARIDYDGERPGVLVFNPLSWRRDGLVRVCLGNIEGGDFKVVGPDGEEMQSAVRTSDDGLDRELVFIARGVPALGYRVFRVEAGPGAAVAADLKADGLTIENEFLKVTVDKESGNISSLYDKKAGREALAEGVEGNRLELHENIPSYWDAWNIGYTGRSWTLDKADSVELIDGSPLSLTIRVKKSFLGLSKANRAPTEGFPSSFFVQDITLYGGSPKLDVRLSVDWWEDHTLLKVSFPFAVTSDRATYEIPYAWIERSTRRDTPAEKARFEVSVHRWADIGDGSYGVSLLNDCKYGMDTHGSVMRLTILTSPLWPDPFADRGRHVINYAVYPHSGSWSSAGAERLGMELNMPLAAVLIGSGKGELPAENSFVQVDGDGVVLACVKAAENANAGEFVFRFVEYHGAETEVSAELPAAIASAVEVDFLEDQIAETAFEGGTLKFKIKPHEVKSFKVRLQR